MSKKSFSNQLNSLLTTAPTPAPPPVAAAPREPQDQGTNKKKTNKKIMDPRLVVVNAELAHAALMQQQERQKGIQESVSKLEEKGKYEEEKKDTVATDNDDDMMHSSNNSFHKELMQAYKNIKSKSSGSEDDIMASNNKRAKPKPETGSSPSYSNMRTSFFQNEDNDKEANPTREEKKKRRSQHIQNKLEQVKKRMSVTSLHGSMTSQGSSTATPSGGEAYQNSFREENFPMPSSTASSPTAANPRSKKIQQQRQPRPEVTPTKKRNSSSSHKMQQRISALESQLYSPVAIPMEEYGYEEHEDEMMDLNDVAAPAPPFGGVEEDSAELQRKQSARLSLTQYLDNNDPADDRRQQGMKYQNPSIKSGSSWENLSLGLSHVHPTTNSKKSSSNNNDSHATFNSWAQLTLTTTDTDKKSQEGVMEAPSTVVEEEDEDFNDRSATGLVKPASGRSLPVEQALDQDSKDDDSETSTSSSSVASGDGYASETSSSSSSKESSRTTSSSSSSSSESQRNQLQRHGSRVIQNVDAMLQQHDDESSSSSSYDSSTTPSSSPLKEQRLPSLQTPNESANDGQEQEMAWSEDDSIRMHLICTELETLLPQLYSALRDNENESLVDDLLVESLLKAAFRVTYRKKYLNMTSDQFVYFSSVSATLLDYSLLDEAEDYYGEEIPMVVTSELRNLAAQMAAEQHVDPYYTTNPDAAQDLVDIQLSPNPLPSLDFAPAGVVDSTVVPAHLASANQPKTVYSDDDQSLGETEVFDPSGVKAPVTLLQAATRAKQQMDQEQAKKQGVPQHLASAHQPKRQYSDDDMSLGQGEVFDATAAAGPVTLLEAATRAKKQMDQEQAKREGVPEHLASANQPRRKYSDDDESIPSQNIFDANQTGPVSLVEAATRAKQQMDQDKARKEGTPLHLASANQPRRKYSDDEESILSQNLFDEETAQGPVTLLEAATKAKRQMDEEEAKRQGLPVQLATAHQPTRRYSDDDQSLGARDVFEANGTGPVSLLEAANRAKQQMDQEEAKRQGIPAHLASVNQPKTAYSDDDESLGETDVFDNVHGGGPVSLLEAARRAKEQLEAHPEEESDFDGSSRSTSLHEKREKVQRQQERLSSLLQATASSTIEATELDRTNPQIQMLQAQVQNLHAALQESQRQVHRLQVQGAGKEGASKTRSIPAPPVVLTAAQVQDHSKDDTIAALEAQLQAKTRTIAQLQVQLDTHELNFTEYELDRQRLEQEAMQDDKGWNDLVRSERGQAAVPAHELVSKLLLEQEELTQRLQEETCLRQQEKERLEQKVQDLQAAVDVLQHRLAQVPASYPSPMLLNPSHDYMSRRIFQLETEQRKDQAKIQELEATIQRLSTTNTQEDEERLLPSDIDPQNVDQLQQALLKSQRKMGILQSQVAYQTALNESLGLLPGKSVQSPGPTTNSSNDRDASLIQVHQLQRQLQQTRLHHQEHQVQAAQREAELVALLEDARQMARRQDGNLLLYKLQSHFFL